MERSAIIESWPPLTLTIETAFLCLTLDNTKKCKLSKQKYDVDTSDSEDEQWPRLVVESLFVTAGQERYTVDLVTSTVCNLQSWDMRKLVCKFRKLRNCEI